MITKICVALPAFCFLAVPLELFAAEPPLMVAHRGLLHHAPENTLANFRACLELRLGSEFDVEKTKDGHLVSIHDGTVGRTTSGTGNVADLTLEEIRRLDAGSWFDPKFAGEKVPTIDEVLQLVALYQQHDFLLAVDLKAEDVEQEVVRLAEKHSVLHRLFSIGRTISEPKVRDQIRAASKIRTIAIGDIHGCSIAFEALIDTINPQPDDTIIPLGNYVDRGIDSKGVLEQLIELRDRCDLVPIPGNHDQMTLHAKDGRSDFQFRLNCGGDAALDSYGSSGRVDLICRRSSERNPFDNSDRV